MSINDETMGVSRARKRRLRELTDATTVALAYAYADLWDDLHDQYDRGLQDAISRLGDGQPLTTAHLERNDLIQQSLGVTHDRLEELAETTGTRIAQDVEYIINSTPPSKLDELRTQLPPGTSGSRVQFSYVNPDALESIVTRSTQRITSQSVPLAPWMETRMRRALTTGMAAGDSPRAVADDIMARTQGAFAGGLGRAQTIARTEMLDAAREADMATYEANSDLITGQVWLAELDGSTCISCISQHGTVHPPDEFGPLDHQNGRCTFITKLKTWSELGFEGIDEPPDVISPDDGLEFFNSLTEDTQRNMMGPGRYELWQNGDIAWEDLAQRQDNPGWRPAYYETPLKALI